MRPNALLIVLAALVFAGAGIPVQAAGPDPLSPVTGEAPQADFAYAPKTLHAGDAVTFTSTATSGMPILLHQWRIEDRGEETTALGPETTYTFARWGVYNVTLTVVDAASRAASVTRTVVVANTPPVAAFDVEPAVTYRNVPVRFTDNSTDRDGDRIVAYAWNFGDGRVANGAAQVTHAYAALGAYTVELHVQDEVGHVAAATRVVHVVNAPPQVHGSVEPRWLRTGEPAWFNASAMDPDSDAPPAVSWTFSDGVTLHGARVTRTFAQAGSYAVTLGAEDSEGARSEPVVLAFQVHDAAAEG